MDTHSLLFVPAQVSCASYSRLNLVEIHSSRKRETFVLIHSGKVNSLEGGCVNHNHENRFSTSFVFSEHVCFCWERSGVSDSHIITFLGRAN